MTDYLSYIPFPIPEDQKGMFFAIWIASTTIGILYASRLSNKSLRPIIASLFLLILVHLVAATFDNHRIITFTAHPPLSEDITLIFPMWACGDVENYWHGGKFYLQLAPADMRSIRASTDCIPSRIFGDVAYIFIFFVQSFLYSLLIFLSIAQTRGKGLMAKMKNILFTKKMVF